MSIFEIAKNLLSGLSCVVIDVARLRSQIIKDSQFSIGYGTINTWNLETDKPPSTILTFRRTSSELEVESTNPNAKLIVDGKASSGEPLSFEAVHTLQVEEECFLVYVTKKPSDWLSGIDLNHWVVFEFSTGAVHGPFDQEELRSWVTETGKDPSKLKYVPKGMYTGFRVDQILGMELPAPQPETQSAPQPRKKVSVETPKQESNRKKELQSESPRPEPNATGESSSARCRCPHCWGPYSREELLNIAVHESLRGDPLLGEEEMLRFKSDTFNQHNIPLDAHGTPCLEYACPHCHLRVIPGLCEIPQAFISIFGAPGAGKSYFLSVLTHELQRKSLEKWELHWEDPDPTGNAPLNGMRHRIFSADFARDAYLAKTSLDGHLYSKTSIHGRKTQLPRPFTYILEGDQNRVQSLTFYDNAGEQYQPDMDGINNPVTHHVAHSHLWCFLFDPSKDGTFRKFLKDSKDPQLTRRFPKENQELLLSELKNRVRTLHHLPSFGKLNTPLAFIIGKKDMLEEWEPVSQLSDPWEGNQFNSDVVMRNSDILREGLLQMVPNLVSQAEAVAEKVVYFASTTFGHPPRPIKDGFLSPLPKRIKPEGVEVPIFWWLNSWSEAFHTESFQTPAQGKESD